MVDQLIYTSRGSTPWMTTLECFTFTFVIRGDLDCHCCAALHCVRQMQAADVKKCTGRNAQGNDCDRISRPILSWVRNAIGWRKRSLYLLPSTHQLFCNFRSRPSSFHLKSHPQKILLDCYTLEILERNREPRFNIQFLKRVKTCITHSTATEACSPASASSCVFPKGPEVHITWSTIL